MYILISVLIIVVCVLLSLIVLVQNSKGGGLASNFAGSNQIMGVRKTNDFLEKATWGLAIALLVLCISAAMTIPRETANNKSQIEQQIQSTPDPTAEPIMPTSAPVETPKEKTAETK
jgi:preprotein translocase subunit SecG